MTSTALLTNKTPSGTYRAPGRYEGSFFCEQLIELAARDLGIDSAEMRRRNLIGVGEMPYRLPRLEPGGPAVDTECDSGDYHETLERCVAEFGWKEKRALQGREIDGRYHGVAVACFIEGGGAGPKETAARPRGGWHSVGLCRLGCGRAGPRNGDGADRGGHARPAARSGARLTRLDPPTSEQAPTFQ